MSARISIFLIFLILLVGLAGSTGFGVEGDIVFKREGGAGGTPLAVFPHWSHRIRYKCYACHPTIFKMKAGANKVSMEAIQKGESCGVCHNGKIAWAVTFQACGKCHAATK